MILALFASLFVSQAGDAEIVKLPIAEQGDGLAAEYPADVGLADDGRVVFADGFEREEAGDGWTETSGRARLVTDAEGVHSGKRGLRLD